LLKLGSLKKYFIRKSFRKLLLEKELIRVVSQNEINTVCIIVAEDIFSLIDLQREVEEGLNLQNAKIYSFRTYSRKNAFSDKHFSEKYFGWNGQVKQPDFKVFIEKPFDLLIGYFGKNNLYLENAVLLSKAKFKVGISKVNQELYDIEIATSPKNIKEFLSELKRYLKILKKMKN
jgi:hypothetical protein